MPARRHYDPFAVNACYYPPQARKGYGLMMMIDILSGISAGAAVWPPSNSMYEDLHAGRNLGQLHLVINPAFFLPVNAKHISQTMQELNSVKLAPEF